MSAGRRVDPVDRAWAGLYAGMHISGIRVPSPDAVRAAMARVVAGRPDTPYGGTLDPGRLRWVPVPAARVDALVERVVVAGPDPEPGGEEAALERLAGEHAADLPVRLTVGPTSLGYTGSHMVGDAVTAALLLRSLLDADPGPVLRERRLDARLLAATTLDQTRRHGRDWGRLASPGPAGAAPRGRAAARALPAAAARPDVETTTRLVARCCAARTSPSSAAGGRSTPGACRRRRSSRASPPARCSPTASSSTRAVTTRWSTCAATSSGCRPARRSAATSPRRSACGPTCSTRVGRPGLSLVVASARPVPATVIGAALAAARAPGPLPRATGAPLALTWNSVPGLPGMDTLPWLDPRGGRYVGAGFPVGGDGLSVVAHRLRSHLELTASVAPGTASPALVQQALAGLVDLARSELPACESRTPPRREARRRARL